MDGQTVSKFISFYSEHRVFKITDFRILNPVYKHAYFVLIQSQAWTARKLPSRAIFKTPVSVLNVIIINELTFLYKP